MNLRKLTPEQQFLFTLGGITLLGLLLRLHGLWSESFTADELDTVIRIKSSRSLHELLDVWVRHDGHPPFTHLLEFYWTKIFGFSEGAVRFPFALMGAAATWFAGRTARMWFSTGAGIAVAAGVAFLQFPLMYSQLARPYAPGFFFSMMLAWYWSRWLFAERRRRRDLYLFVVAGAGAAFSHYFSLLFAGLLGGLGLFFLRKETWKGYVIAGLAIIVLFLPYIGIFRFQLNAGGVGGPHGWLGKPTPAFFRTHLWFIFDESRIVLYGSVLLAIATFILFFRRPDKFQLIAFLLWGAPLVIGYVWSVKSNPVLQNSVLLFSFPFLLMLLFSRMPPLENWKKGVIPAAYGVILFLYVTVYKPFHLTDHFGRIAEIAQATLDAEEKVGRENLTCAFGVDYPYYMGYYWEKYHHAPKYVITYHNKGGSMLKEFKQQLENAKGNYFVYAWSTIYAAPEIVSLIREKFPKLVAKNYYYNSEWYLFSRDPSAQNMDESDEVMYNNRNEMGDPVVEISTVKPKPGVWSMQDNVVLMDSSCLMHNAITSPYEWSWYFTDTTSQQACLHGQRLDSKHTYSSGLSVNVGEVIKNSDNIVLIKAGVALRAPNAEAIIVVEFLRDGKSVSWNGISSATQIDSSEWKTQTDVYFGLRLPADLKRSDLMHVFIYTPNGAPFDIDYLEVSVLKGHAEMFGPHPDYQ